MTRRAVTLLFGFTGKSCASCAGYELAWPAGQPFPISRAARAAGQTQYSIWQLVTLPQQTYFLFD